MMQFKRGLTGLLALWKGLMTRTSLLRTTCVITQDELYVTRTSKKVVKPQSLGRFFHYLDRYLTVLRRLPSLKETSFSCFYELVFSEVNDKVRNAIFSMFDHVGDAIFQIDREWEGEQIDQALVKNVIDLYMEMGMGSVEFYEKDFEQAMLEEATAFHSQKTSNWITS
ncbi:cullin-1-like [Vitis riparia]|uniref:cullin-1-like n=1 Tax=Vitis riparia TaxID=96939 RepID=UPI00155AC500|nr:cullin-1-like [Vitis riparia]